jgi:ABC-type uncharacterized transport system substrate-binding protein
MKTWFAAFLIAVVVALAGGFAGAQQTTKVPRIGYLGLDDPSSSFFKSFRDGLREVGYIEGQNIIIEPRFAFGNDWRLGGLAAELVRLKVDVIVTQHVITARGVTRTIPIVMAYSGDPVEARIVASVERPGGNVTGIGGMATGLGGKWLEILKQTIPEVRRVGVLYFSNPDQNFRNPVREPPIMKELEVAARSLRVELQPGEVGVRYSNTIFARPVESGVGAAFTWATRGQADALIVLPGLVVNRNLSYIAQLALKRHLPGIFWQADFAEAGGLMTYGANENEQLRRAAYIVDKILKGANPAELPVELPKKFELVINLKTANEIGVKIPDKMLTWADRVIK